MVVHMSVICQYHNFVFASQIQIQLPIVLIVVIEVVQRLNCVILQQLIIKHKHVQIWQIIFKGSIYDATKAVCI